MTYKTRQEVLRAAANWIDVCEAACVDAKYKFLGEIGRCYDTPFKGNPEGYEFPLALLEGKEVWVGSEPYGPDRRLFIVESTDGFNLYGHHVGANDTVCFDISLCSWTTPPKPVTVMVELAVDDAEKMSRDANERLAGTYAYDRVGLACKKALEKL